MKKTLKILTLILLLATTAQAQIYTGEGEGNNRLEGLEPSNGLYVDNPNGHGYGTDYYAPLGEGILLLAALGGAYLCGKRRKQISETN